MQIISINIGKPEPLANKTPRSKTPTITGINKMSVVGPVNVGKLGLEGDSIVNKKHHGGVDQAVYLYSLEDYAWWENELGHALAYGIFGENLTISGIESAAACVGDRYAIGNVVLEVTSPRIPCSIFSAHMNDAKFAKRFTAAKRPGIYCRVLNEGSISTGDSIAIQKYQGEEVTLVELFESNPHKDLSAVQRARYLKVPSHWKLIAYLNGERVKP